MNKDKDTVRQRTCEACGAINRISHYPFGSKPVCGKCGTPLAQTTAEKIG